MRVKNVAEWLDNAASRYPDKVAVSDGVYSLTYSELKELSQRIATYFIGRGFFKQPIFVHLGREPRAIVCFMACAYSGNFYVPIDPDTPNDRIEAIRTKIEPAFQVNYDNFDSLSALDVDIDKINECFQKQIDSDLLYIVFTSGSTGIPKCVAVPHRSVIEYIDKIVDILHFSTDTIHCQIAQPYFDGSITPMYSALYLGSTNYLIPKKLLMINSKFLGFLNEYKCTAIHATPTFYNFLLKSGALDVRVPQYLKTCSFGGEVMPSATVNGLRKYLPNVSFVNIYGPCETVGNYTTYEVNGDIDESNMIPIGKNVLNCDVLILNEKNELCGTNEHGEICLRSSRMSLGYYNDPQKTAEVFVQNPLNSHYNELIYRTGDIGYVNDNNEIMILGRKDNQIKHLGKKVDLCEIEAVSMNVPNVNACGCVYDKSNLKIVLFYSGNATDGEIKDYLKKKLPSYMLPQNVVHINTFKLTNTGKIDRKYLLSQIS